jgi:hypothetical protein
LPAASAPRRRKSTACFDLRHSSRMDAIERAFHALGHSVDLVICKVA